MTLKEKILQNAGTIPVALALQLFQELPTTIGQQRVVDTELLLKYNWKEVSQHIVEVSSDVCTFSLLGRKFKIQIIESETKLIIERSE